MGSRKRMPMAGECRGQDLLRLTIVLLFYTLINYLFKKKDKEEAVVYLYLL